MNMKKLLTLILALTFVFALAAPAAFAADSYTVGICQLVQHPALDAATQGFKDALTKALGDKVIEAANKALTALEELVKVAPDCYVDMSEDPYAEEYPVFLCALVEQWKRQNFSFNY
jgi:predicted TPR repeat methyltransferase